MPTQDTTRRLRPQLISEDVNSWHGLQTIGTYETTRADASATNLYHVRLKTYCLD